MQKYQKVHSFKQIPVYFTKINLFEYFSPSLLYVFLCENEVLLFSRFALKTLHNLRNFKLAIKPQTNDQMSCS